MPSFFMYSNHIEFSVYFILLAWTYRLLLRLLAKEFRRGFEITTRNVLRTDVSKLSYEGLEYRKNSWEIY